MSDGPTEIHGTCEPGFEPVREAFAANFAERGEIGASAAVVVGGRPVVNLWAGWADPARTRPWQQDTLTNVWSTTKAVTSLSAHLLMDRGELDPDAPVARYWPEFGQAGKAEHPGPFDHEPPVRADRPGGAGQRRLTTTTGRRSPACSPRRSRCSRRARPADIRPSPLATWSAR